MQCLVKIEIFVKNQNLGQSVSVMPYAILKLCIELGFGKHSFVHRILGPSTQSDKSLKIQISQLPTIIQQKQR